VKQRADIVAIAVVLGGALVGCARSGPDSFKTPDEAVGALVTALEHPDTRSLQSLLGPGTADLLSSGDAVADKRARESFLERYRSRHELVEGNADTLVLVVGQDRWPLPIPLVRDADRWEFDGAAGAHELVLRRIGANELSTINVMHGYVAAQRDYGGAGHDGSAPGVYAAKLRSDPGKHDGLYWDTAPGDPPSPAGPLLASANSEGYTLERGGRVPYHGYLFRTLTSQGPAAEGGARDYKVNGELTGGFALLAYPQRYGVSGIMTFIVNQDGVVWQRDLGKDTARAALAIQQFDPDDGWTPLAPES
jgi:hypothetical protein